MDKVKKISKCIIFFIIGLFILHKLTYILVPKWVSTVDPASPRFDGFYSQEKNTLDVLVVGASDVGRGYSPITVWNQYGITSYNLGTSNQTMSLAYYVIKEALKYQQPKVIVLDMDATFVTNDAPEGEYRKLFDNMKLDEVKIQAVWDENVRADNKLSYIFPILRFHSRWNELVANDVKKSLKNKYQSISYQGMAMNCDIVPYMDTKKYMEEKGEVEEITSENLYYINKIVELCKENNIQLLWTEIPSSISWSLARSKKTAELANTYGIEFIDYNLEPIQKELGFDWKIHTADKGNHLNVNGAEIISKHIGKVLQEKYNCISNKNNKTIAEKWEKEATRYEENMKKLEQEQENKQKKINRKS